MKGFLPVLASVCAFSLMVLATIAILNDFPTNLVLGVVGIALVLAVVDWLEGSFLTRLTSIGWALLAFTWGVSLLFW